MNTTDIDRRLAASHFIEGAMLPDAVRRVDEAIAKADAAGTALLQAFDEQTVQLRAARAALDEAIRLVETLKEEATR